MKKILTLLVVGLFLFSLMGTMVLAEETEGDISDVELQAASFEEVTDSSGIFLDNVRMRFSFNKQNKVKIAMRIADKRMLQAEEHFKEGNFNKAKVAKQNHEEAMVKAESYIEDLIENGDEEAVKRALAKTIMMQNRIEAHNEKSLEIHARILENKADQMTDEQLSHLEEVFGNIQERSETAESKMIQQQENLRAQYKVLTGMTDEEIDAEMAAYDGFLEGKRKLRQERIKEYKVNQDAFKEQIRQRLNDFGGNVADNSDSGSDSGNQQTGQIVLN